MGYRISKVTTRTGDDGTTGIGDGTRVPKDHARIEALGEVDELNSMLGLVLAQCAVDTLRENGAIGQIRALLYSVQNDLFDAGAALCRPGAQVVRDTQVAALDAAVARLNADLPPLREFILPGGSTAAAACQVARALCRRAERRIVTLYAREGGLPDALLRYFNRLSDLLFVAARAINQATGMPEAYWRSRRTPD